MSKTIKLNHITPVLTSFLQFPVHVRSDIHIQPVTCCCITLVTNATMCQWKNSFSYLSKTTWKSGGTSRRRQLDTVYRVIIVFKFPLSFFFFLKCSFSCNVLTSWLLFFFSSPFPLDLTSRYKLQLASLILQVCWGKVHSLINPLF